MFGSLKKTENDTYIYSALAKSNNLIVISTESKYLESSWVKSEWFRWLRFIEIGKRKIDTLYLFIPTLEFGNVNIPTSLSEKWQAYIDESELKKDLYNIKNRVSKLKKRTIHRVEVEPKDEEISLINAAKRYLNNKRFDVAKEIVNNIIQNNKFSYDANKISFLAENEVTSFDEWQISNIPTKEINLLENLLILSNDVQRNIIFEHIYQKLVNCIEDYELLDFYVSYINDTDRFSKLLNISLRKLLDKQVKLLSDALLDSNYRDHRAYFAKYLISIKVNNYIDLIDKLNVNDINLKHAINGFREDNEKKSIIYYDLDFELSEVKNEDVSLINKDDFIIDLNNINFSKEKILNCIKEEKKKIEHKKKTDEIIKSTKFFLSKNLWFILRVCSIITILTGSFLSWFEFPWYIYSCIVLIGLSTYSFFHSKDNDEVLKIDLTSNIGYILCTINSTLIFTNNLYTCWLHNNYFPLLIIYLPIIIQIIVLLKTLGDDYKYVISSFLLAIATSIILVGMHAATYYSIHATFSDDNMWYVLLFESTAFIVPSIINRIGLRIIDEEQKSLIVSLSCLVILIANGFVSMIFNNSEFLIIPHSIVCTIYIIYFAFLTGSLFSYKW